MLDFILFGTIGLLLLVLVGFLIIVVRDHMKSRSFDFYVHQSEEALHIDPDDYASFRSAQTNETPESRQGPKDSSAPGRPHDAEPAGKTAPKVDLEVERMFRRRLRKNAVEAGGLRTEPPLGDDETEAERSRTGPSVPPLKEGDEAGGPSLTPSQKQARRILAKNYGRFDHGRLVDGMGLSAEEADEFVVELIRQLESAIAPLEEAAKAHRYDELEHITHGLKGAALNIGEGGVAQLLVDFNTYMKNGTEKPIIEAYLSLLKRTVSELKVEYSQVA